MNRKRSWTMTAGRVLATGAPDNPFKRSRSNRQQSDVIETKQTSRRVTLTTTTTTTTRLDDRIVDEVDHAIALELSTADSDAPKRATHQLHHHHQQRQRHQQTREDTSDVTDSNEEEESEESEENEEDNEETSPGLASSSSSSTTIPRAWMPIAISHSGLAHGIEARARAGLLRFLTEEKKNLRPNTSAPSSSSSSPLIVINDDDSFLRVPMPFTMSSSITFTPRHHRRSSSSHGHSHNPRHGHGQRHREVFSLSDSDDLDEMTYEELQDLEERNGSVVPRVTAASRSAIQHLPTFQVEAKKNAPLPRNTNKERKTQPVASQSRATRATPTHEAKGPKGSNESKEVKEAKESKEPQDSTSNTCSICLEEFKPGETIKLLPCMHKFHDAEITKWLKRDGRCPNCKFFVSV